MEIITGRSIQGQIAYGRLKFFKRRIMNLVRNSQLTWEEELARVDWARHQASITIASLYDKASMEVGEEIASIFSMHSLLLVDEGLVESITDILKEQHVTAEYAVNIAATDLIEFFQSMEDPYMRARAADIRDVCRHILANLVDRRPVDPFGDSPVILVSDELLPSEVMWLNQRKLLGYIARKGSVDSHSAMLLDAYHIPAMAMVDLDSSYDGHPAILDGFDGRLYLDPSPSLADTLRLRYEAGGKPAAAVAVK